MTSAPHTSAMVESELIALADRLEKIFDGLDNRHICIRADDGFIDDGFFVASDHADIIAALRAASSPARVAGDREAIARIIDPDFESPARTTPWAEFKAARHNATLNKVDLILSLLRAPADGGSGRHPGWWTHDAEAAKDIGEHLYYFAPANRSAGPYKTQQHVKAIIDIAPDGTLAGVELIDGMPAPPSSVSSDVRADFESQAKATEGKAGMAGGHDASVRRSTAGTGLRVGVSLRGAATATSEAMDVTAGETAPSPSVASNDRGGHE